MRIAITCSILCLTLLLIGCGGGSSGTKIQGTAKIDGKPLAGASVYVESEGKGSDSGVVSPDGSFVISNAPAGKVKVAILVPPPPPPEMPKLPEGEKGGPKIEMITPEAYAVLATIPTRFRECSKSGLTYDVGSRQALEISIKSTD